MPNDETSTNNNGKGSIFLKQETKVYLSLKERPKTTLMVSVETGILRANICRHVETLRKKGLIQLYKIGLCQISNHRAGYHTTNPDLFTKS